MPQRHFSGERIEFTGTPLASGIAVGQALRFRQIDLESLKQNVFAVKDIDAEMRRLNRSIRRSKEQLLGLLRSSLESERSDVADIFSAHIQLLEDDTFLESIRDAFRQVKLNIEHVLSNKIADIERNFEAIDNEIVRTKLYDIQDVYQRLLRNLLEIEHVRVTPLLRPKAHPILVAERLLPSDIALLEFRKIEGLVMEEGSAVSHVAIITRSYGIPALINIPGIAALVRQDTPLILDCFSGKLIINPSDTEAGHYRAVRRLYSQQNGRNSLMEKPCLTKDGVRIRLDANANTPDEIREALQHGAEGVGLLRSEIFYLAHGNMPPGHEEQAFFESVFAASGGKPLTIRLLDIGADKSPSYMSMEPESNPQLGVRGMRYLLNHPTFMRQHLESIIRAAKNVEFRILLPFVAVPREVDTALAVIDEICRTDGIDRAHVNIGIMVEIPSVVWSLPAFASRISFLSIGTNDLIQFTFAASREDSRLDRYRRESLPVLFKVIRHTLAQGKARGIDVSVCGELASDPAVAVLLVGLGIRALSVQPSSLEIVRRQIEGKTLAQAAELVQEILQYTENDDFPFAKSA